MNPYVFTGNYLKALKAIGLPEPDNVDSDLTIVDRDLPRHLIIGTQDECKQFFKIWQYSEDLRHYWQGTMDARNLVTPGFYSSCLNKKFKYPETYGDMKCHKLKASFGTKAHDFSACYLDDQGQPAGFCIYFNPLDTAQWVIGIIRNPHLTTDKREVFLMSSMKSFANNGPDFKEHAAKKTNSTIRDAFHSRLLSNVFGELIDEDGHVKLACLPSRGMGKRFGDPQFGPLHIDPDDLKAFHSRVVKEQDPTMSIHYFSGNYSEAVRALGFSEETLQNVFLAESADIHTELEKDELRDGSFIGSTAEYNHFWATWKKAGEIDTHYCQGNRDGSVFTGKPYFMNWMAGKLPDDVPEYSESQKDIRIIRELYLDNENNPCGFSVVYNEKNPQQWLIVVIRNGHLAPEDRQVQLFSTVTALPDTVSTQPSDITAINKRIASALDSQNMSGIFGNLIRANGVLDDRQFKVLDDPAFQCSGKRIDPLRARIGASALMEAGAQLNVERQQPLFGVTLEDYKNLTPALNAVLYEHVETLDRDYQETIPEEIRRNLEEALATLFAMPHSENPLALSEKYTAINAFHRAILALEPYEHHADIKAMIYECNLAVIKLQVQAGEVVQRPAYFKLLQEANKGKPFQLKQIKPEELRLKPRLQAYLHQQLDALDKKAKELGKKNHVHLQVELEGTVTRLKENIDTLFAIQHTTRPDKTKTEAEIFMIHECKFAIGGISDEVKKHRGFKRIFERIIQALEKRGKHPHDRRFFQTKTEKLLKSVIEVFGDENTPPGHENIYPASRG